MGQAAPLRPGDRVRVRRPESEYTGCRGTVAPQPQPQADANVMPLGYFVAIDGENGVVRPFLVQDLELIRPARVRSSAGAGRGGGRAADASGEHDPS